MTAKEVLETMTRKEWIEWYLEWMEATDGDEFGDYWLSVDLSDKYNCFVTENAVARYRRKLGLLWPRGRDCTTFIEQTIKRLANEKENER